MQRDQQINLQNNDVARESFSARTRTNPEYDEAAALVGILKREIERSGSFNEPLTDYSHAYARTKQFDAETGETILRDLFKAFYGKTMNQMREDLTKQEENLPPESTSLALTYADAVGAMIESGTKINFNRAFAHQAEAMAIELGITDAGAKRLMKQEFKAAHDRDFYEWGKDIEERFYRPQIEAEKHKREEQSATRDSGSTRKNSRMQYQR